MLPLTSVQRLAVSYSRLPLDCWRGGSSRRGWPSDMSRWPAPRAYRAGCGDAAGNVPTLPRWHAAALAPGVRISGGARPIHGRTGRWLAEKEVVEREAAVAFAGRANARALLHLLSPCSSVVKGGFSFL